MWEGGWIVWRQHKADGSSRGGVAGGGGVALIWSTAAQQNERGGW